VVEVRAVTERVKGNGRPDAVVAGVASVAVAARRHRAAAMATNRRLRRRPRLTDPLRDTSTAIEALRF
jgi:hypothetical protein